MKMVQGIYASRYLIWYDLVAITGVLSETIILEIIRVAIRF